MKLASSASNHGSNESQPPVLAPLSQPAAAAAAAAAAAVAAGVNERRPHINIARVKRSDVLFPGGGSGKERTV